MLIEVTDETYVDEIENSQIPCLIGFHASWCTLCPKMLSILDDLSEKYEGALKFCAINVDEQRKLRIMFAIAALPYVAIVDNGMKTPLFDELVTKEALEKRIDHVLSGGKCPSTVPLKKMR